MLLIVSSQHMAFVTLHNGMRFQGSVARSKDQAAESAASVALINLVRQLLTSGP